MVVPELNCCALDSFRLFTVSSPQIEEDPLKYSSTTEWSPLRSRVNHRWFHPREPKRAPKPQLGVNEQLHGLHAREDSTPLALPRRRRQLGYRVERQLPTTRFPPL